jgi:CRISPR-associated protein Cas1
MRGLEEERMATAPILIDSPAGRKPPVSLQFNWIKADFESAAPEQMPLPLPIIDSEVMLPGDDRAFLLQTENGSQLVISGFGLFAGRKSERVVIRQSGSVCAQVPLMRLQEIVIASKGISLSSDLIESACERGIRVSFLNQGGKPFALLTSPMLTATVATRRAQFAAAENGRGADFCRWIVAGKLRNQEKLLRYFSRTREGKAGETLMNAAASLRKIRRSAISLSVAALEDLRPQLLGLEGAGARIYWNAMASGLNAVYGFPGRDPDGSDPVNASLNLGYGILLSHVWGAVMNAGLEPFAGFLHTDRSGKPSLALDLMEELRQPIVDRPIFAWLYKGGKPVANGGLLCPDTREEVVARVLRRLTAQERYRGKDHELRSIVQQQARLAAVAFRGERVYRPFSFQW